MALLNRMLFPYQHLPLKVRFGDWAVVTGATDGIGCEYAKQLARRGINIVLVSRSSEKLAEVAHNIESQYNVQTKCITVNFCDGKNIYDRIEKELSDIPVGILVNSIGRMYDFPDELTNVSIDVLWDMINMNIGSMLTMTHIVLKGMKARRRGAIVNISSGSELQPVSYLTLYAATKIFVRQFSLGLQYELQPYGISLQLLSPFCVQTKFHTYPLNIIFRHILFPRPEQFAKWAVFTLGKTTETTGYWTHAIMNVGLGMLPIYVRTMIMSTMAKRTHKAYLEEKRKENAAQGEISD